jgi:ABC-type branched-subunit amino acid transport system substrate-binding protein
MDEVISKRSKEMWARPEFRERWHAAHNAALARPEVQAVYSAANKQRVPKYQLSRAQASPLDMVAAIEMRSAGKRWVDIAREFGMRADTVRVAVLRMQQRWQIGQPVTANRLFTARRWNRQPTGEVTCESKASEPEILWTLSAK